MNVFLTFATFTDNINKPNTSMKQKKARLVILLGLVLLSLGSVSSCKEKDDLPSSKREKEKERGVYSDYSQVRSMARSQDPDRYLGRNFNKLRFAQKDVQGFLPSQVLDANRLASNSPWSPFGEAIPSSVSSPDRIAQEGSLAPINSTYKAFGEEGFRDSVNLDLGAGYKSVHLGYTHQSYTSRTEKSYLYRTLLGYKYSYRMYDMEDDKDYGFFLSRRFVRDLRRLSASELIDKYGTHIVTSYSTGAFQELTVVANSSFFSSTDMESISGTLWGDKGSATSKHVKKVTQYRDQIGFTYLQAGSDYLPPRPFLQPTALFNNGQEVMPLDHLAFKEKIRKEENAFFELEGANVAIPSIIHSLPLKVKYTCGILDRIRPGGQPATMYVLSDPSTYQRIPYQSSFLNIMLSKYQDAQVYVYIGPSAYRLLQEEGGQDNKQTRWQASLNEDGLWTLQSIHTKKYLCRDLKMRTLAEDTAGLRYWGLNPSVPTSRDSNPYALSTLLVRH